MNLDDKVDELFSAIEESLEYKKYMEINEVMNNNSKIKKIVNEIKKLQKEAVKLENKGDLSYKDIDKLVLEKKKELNKIPLYQEYVRRMNEVNDLLAESSFQIENYINSKI